MLGKDGASSKPDCPYCGSQNIIRYGHKCNKQRFLCRDCGRTFTTTTHTVMSNSHFSPEVWADVIEDTLRGNSIGYTAKRLGLYHQATFAMRHKILIPLQQMPLHHRLHRTLVITSIMMKMAMQPNITMLVMKKVSMSVTATMRHAMRMLY